MRLTQYTDFSIRVLIYLALNQGRRCTISEIAERYSISRNHLMKVVQQLASAGFVRSTRGSGGGLELGSPPEQIRLDAVVLEMEPDFGMVECLRPCNRCVITPACGLPPILQRAVEAFVGELQRHTLADLVPEHRQETLAVILRIHE